MLITIVPVLGILVPVLKTTTTVVPAARGTAETGTKLVNVIAAPVTSEFVQALLSVEDDAHIPLVTAAIGPPMVTPVKVNCREPAVIAVVAVRVTTEFVDVVVNAAVAVRPVTVLATAEK